MPFLTIFLRLIFTLSTLSFTACSSFSNNSKNIRIETTPSMASITTLSADGQIRTLGQSPLEISESEVFQNNNMVYLQATLNGFKENSLYIPKTERLKEMNITLRLKELPLFESKKNDQVNNLLSEIAKAQAMIFQKKYAAAQSLLENLVGTQPDIAVIRDLLGNALYLSGKNKEALDIYLKAEAIDPNNGTRKLIINKLQEQ